jgi:hypothetical protein
VEVDADGTTVVAIDDERRIPDLVLALAAAGARLTRVEPRRTTLEDLYFAVRSKRPTADDGGGHLGGRLPPPPPPPRSAPVRVEAER